LLTRFIYVTSIDEVNLTFNSMSFKYVHKNVLYVSHELCFHLHDSHGTAIRHVLTLRQSDSCGICNFIIQVFINPKLTVVSYEKVLFPEACESVRGFSADVARYREVLVTGRWCRWILRGPAVHMNVFHSVNSLYLSCLRLFSSLFSNKFLKLHYLGYTGALVLHTSIDLMNTFVCMPSCWCVS